MSVSLFCITTVVPVAEVCCLQYPLVKPFMFSNAANTVLTLLHLQLYSPYFTAADAFATSGHGNRDSFDIGTYNKNVSRCETIVVYS